ncbi:MAG: hypothetical protein ACRCXT_20490 [Paraclostridium sp.]
MDNFQPNKKVIVKHDLQLGKWINGIEITQDHLELMGLKFTIDTVNEYGDITLCGIPELIWDNSMLKSFSIFDEFEYDMQECGKY